MDKFDTPKHYFRGPIKPKSTYEVWGLSEHVVSVLLPEGSKGVDIVFSYMPPHLFSTSDLKPNAVGVVKTFTKSGIAQVSGRFATVACICDPVEGLAVHYAGYPS